MVQERVGGSGNDVLELGRGSGTWGTAGGSG